jgi:hypothetical protein
MKVLGARETGRDCAIEVDKCWVGVKALEFDKTDLGSRPSSHFLAVLPWASC